MIIIIIKKLVASLVRETVAIIKLPVLYINLFFVFDFVVKPIRGDTFFIYLFNFSARLGLFLACQKCNDFTAGFLIYLFMGTRSLIQHSHLRLLCTGALPKRWRLTCFKSYWCVCFGGREKLRHNISHPRSKGLCSSSASSHEAGRRYPRR